MICDSLIANQLWRTTPPDGSELCGPVGPNGCGTVCNETGPCYTACFPPEPPACNPSPDGPIVQNLLKAALCAAKCAQYVKIPYQYLACFTSCMNPF